MTGAEEGPQGIGAWEQEKGALGGAASSPCVQPREGVPSGHLRGAAEVGLSSLGALRPGKQDKSSSEPLRYTKPRLWSHTPVWSWSIRGVTAQNPRFRSGWSGGCVAQEVPAGPQSLLPGRELRAGRTLCGQ